MMICGKCGNKVKKTLKFCPMCGTKMEEGGAVKQTAVLNSEKPKAKYLKLAVAVTAGLIIGIIAINISQRNESASANSKNGDKPIASSESGTSSEKLDNIHSDDYPASAVPPSAQGAPNPAQTPLLPDKGITEGEGKATGEEVAVYESLDLPIVMTEQTTLRDRSNSHSHYIITTGNDLVVKYRDYTRWNEYIDKSRVIDNNVRSLFCVDKTTYFYIKTDNSLWGWGSNYSGILGDGTGVDRDEPVHILDNVAVIGSKRLMGGIYAIKTDGTYWEWGFENNYEPIMITENIVKYLIFDATSFEEACVLINSDGYVINSKTGKQYIDEPVYDAQVDYSLSAYLPQFTYIDSNKDLKIKMPAKGEANEYEIVLISEDVEEFTGVLSVHFMKSDGSLWGYGKNEKGQLGDGTKIPERNEAVKIADDVIKTYDYAFLKSNGEIWEWDSDNPTPKKVLDNIVCIGAYDSLGWEQYVLTTDGKYVYRYNANNNWERFSDISDFTSYDIIENVKLSQTVIINP